MSPNKSLDDSNNKIIAALLHSIMDVHGEVFNTRACRLTLQIVERRMRSEGMSFLTKTLPRLGKAFDKALSGQEPLDCRKVFFKRDPRTGLPRFLGEFFQRVLDSGGRLLLDPCTNSVRVIRQVLYLFYKYELPYSAESENAVVRSFVEAESDLTASSCIPATQCELSRPQCYCQDLLCSTCNSTGLTPVLRKAKELLNRVFLSFDPRDIYPRHGPGAVSTRERLWAKYEWTNVSSRITDVYPFDEYFCSSTGAVCDGYREFSHITSESRPARVCLVPKDSRGPRLISCESVDYQWIQQGLGRAIVEHVEKHELTKFNVFFTDQGTNRRGAELGSKYGKYATLDLKEASDRVSLWLVRQIFPVHIFAHLEACRSSATVLPDGQVQNLHKFAPMGSALCFPVLALTVWALVTAGAEDTDTREGIAVYGDDVIVPTAYADDAMSILESYGLKVNRDKSCTKGFFRESCGKDAFKGVDVTPIRLRTVWETSPRADVYASWIAYANSFYDRRYYRVYNEIVDRLTSVYGPIPDDGMSHKTYPSLRSNPLPSSRFRSRINHNTQRIEYCVRVVTARPKSHAMHGWRMLLRYFSEGTPPAYLHRRQWDHSEPSNDGMSFRVRQYTSRDDSMLSFRWR